MTAWRIFLFEQAFDFLNNGSDYNSRGFLGAFRDAAFKSH